MWKSQVLLSKVSGISMETSDTFSNNELELCFQALTDLAEAQKEEI